MELAPRRENLKLCTAYIYPTRLGRFDLGVNPPHDGRASGGARALRCAILLLNRSVARRSRIARNAACFSLRSACTAAGISHGRNRCRSPASLMANQVEIHAASA
jgi:hypothetical protein